MKGPLKPLTVDKILSHWVKIDNMDAVADGVSDTHIWALARLAAILAGKRAQDIGNERYENACARFVRAMDGLIKETSIN